MEFDRANIYVGSSNGGEFWQGEILSDLIEFRWAGPGESDIDLIRHPLSIVLSADCDLTQDHKAREDNSDPPIDKLISNILLCDLYPSEELKAKYGVQMKEKYGKQAITSTIWTNVRSNSNERYHYLAEVPANRDLQGHGLESMAMDFKQYFCVSVTHLASQITSARATRRCRLAPPFAQHLAVRFYHYQSRVGLPVDHGDN